MVPNILFTKQFIPGLFSTDLRKFTNSITDVASKVDNVREGGNLLYWSFYISICIFAKLFFQIIYNRKKRNYPNYWSYFISNEKKIIRS